MISVGENRKMEVDAAVERWRTETVPTAEFLNPTL